MVRYVRENMDKRSLRDDQDHLRKLKPYLGDKRLSEISMDALWPFINQRREVDGVQNATVKRVLKIVRRILHLARDEWLWLHSFLRIGMLPEPNGSGSLRLLPCVCYGSRSVGSGG